MGSDNPQLSVDSAALGEAIARSLSPVIERLGTVTKTAEPDKLQSALNALIENSANGGVKPEDIAALLDAHGENMTAKQQNQLNKMLLTERTGRVLSRVDSEIQKYAEHDELVADQAEQIKRDFIKEFDNAEKSEWAEERLNFNTTGNVSAQCIKTIIKRRIERLEKAAGRPEKKETKGAAGTTKTGASTNTTGTPSTSTSGNTEGLSDKQRDLYQSHKNMLLQHGYATDKAHTEALAAAQRRTKPV